MEFVQIKVEDKYYPKRLNRLIAVREDLNLNEIGIVIGKSIGATFEHFFMFEVGKKQYVDESWIDELPLFDIKQFDMAKCYLKDIGNKFEYTYDNGAGYIFVCKVMKKKIEIELNKNNKKLIAKTLKGTGLGIFEDNRSCLCDYFDGRISPNAKEGVEEYDLLPWNLDIDKFGDYDKELDLNKYDLYEKDLDIDNIDLDDYTYYHDIDYDGEIDESVLETFLRETAALDIFEDIDINQIYRKLILTHDINEAYEMIVKCLIDAHKQGNEENLSEEEIDNLYYEAVQDLM